MHIYSLVRIKMKELLTFEDGLLLAKHIYQSAIDKTLKGIPEQEEIFYRAYNQIKKINNGYNNKRLEELLYILNIEDIYQKI